MLDSSHELARSRQPNAWRFIKAKHRMRRRATEGSEAKEGEEESEPRTRSASGRAPRIGRRRPPTRPGPMISSSSSLPVDRYVAALYMRNP